MVPAVIGSCFRAGLLGEMGSLGSGRRSFVPVMKPADLRDRHNATIARCGDRARDRRVLFSDRCVRDCS